MRIGENACPICRSGSGPLIFPNISSVKVVNTEEMRKENERIVAEYEKRMKKLAAAEMLADAITTLVICGYDGPCMGDDFRHVMELIIHYDTLR